MDLVYTTRVFSQGGRNGRVQSEDGLLKLDLATGKLIEAYPLPADGVPKNFGSITVASKGTVYATAGTRRAVVALNAATGAQSAGVAQVGEAVTQLDQVTQQNAALVEESAAAAESLRHQAATLAEVVSVFKMDGGVQSGPRAHAAPIAANASAVERRGPNRAANVARPAFKAKPAAAAAEPRASDAATAKTGTDNWETF